MAPKKMERVKMRTTNKMKMRIEEYEEDDEPSS